MSDSSQLFRVLAAFHLFRTPARVTKALLNREVLEDAIETHLSEMSQVEDHAARLSSENIGVLAVRDPAFPNTLADRGMPIVPALFYKGNPELVTHDCVAVSGSRDVSDRGTSAAARAGKIIAAADLCLVAGNARGVDTVSASSVLANSGRTIFVLPEGISRSQPRAALHDLLTEDNHLVVSQFPPNQDWAAHSAMARNRVICGLSRSVLVVEARQSGGSLAAGREAQKLSRQLLTLTYGDNTPPGNQLLIDEGATPVDSPDALRTLLTAVSEGPEQGTLL
ncbi:DNA-processing protein DprA [Gordonia aquimaris]|uniref:DNA-processing protein DprA n=1 Tax=Gordonia aquimaris TaxID=2984863 RepID=A0A9X3D713_9ACTN|nr:DNA-processing protein DprA [Gordonia aquimaris]MCX2966290.1 DNA-processing protein DprA [Gordonia aquimaris]